MKQRPTTSMALMASLLNQKKHLLRKSYFFLTISSSSSSSSSLFFSTCKKSLFFSPPLQCPPVAKKIPFSVSVHRTILHDPYRWMSNLDDPDLSLYLTQENSYASAFMADTEGLQRELYREMTNRIPSTVSTPPERWGPWLYYQYIPEGKEYPVLCRKLESHESSSGFKNFLNYCARGNSGGEEILLDWNEVAKQYGYVNIGTCRVSPNHNFLAYTLDISGSEWFMLRIKDLRSGVVIPNSQVEGVVSLAWAQDGNTLLYTISDENQRPYRVYCTKLGCDGEEDNLVFSESDPHFCVDITSTKDGKFITVNSNSRTSSEVYVINSDNPLGGLKRVHQRISDVQYFLEHHNGFFYVLTNGPLSDKEWCGVDYYLARCGVEDLLSANWKDVILPGEDLTLQDMDIFNGHLVLFVNKNDVPMFCSINLPLDGNDKHELEIQNLNPWFFPLPSNSCSVVPASNHDFMSSVFRVVLSCPVMPDMIVDYDMSSRTFSVVHQDEVKSVSYHTTNKYTSELDVNNPSKAQEEKVCINNLHIRKEFSDTYSCERKEVISHGGMKISLTILYSRTTWRKGQSPGLLQGYGSYGEVLDKSWSSDRLSLLDRGFVVAFADVRGGGGNNSTCHKSGSGLNKKNSIYDFVSCANYLINEGYVHKDLLGSIGFSAGGLLVGAAINMYPSLFRAAILKVPFLDVCNTLLDPNLPLTRLDYEEFGNPEIQSNFEYILSYSPYNNINQIHATCYPSMLVTASFHDSRVGVWEAVKWVAKLRERTCSGCSWSTILKTNMNGGHFGEGGRYSQCEETAYDYAFLIKAMGMFDKI